MTTLRSLVLPLLMSLAAQNTALINPNFTPIHLVNQFTLVVELEMAPVRDGKSVGTVKQVLKGKLESKTVTFDLPMGAAVCRSPRQGVDATECGVGSPVVAGRNPIVVLAELSP